MVNISVRGKLVHAGLAHGEISFWGRELGDFDLAALLYTIAIDHPAILRLSSQHVSFRTLAIQKVDWFESHLLSTVYQEKKAVGGMNAWIKDILPVMRALSSYNWEITLHTGLLTDLYLKKGQTR